MSRVFVLFLQRDAALARRRELRRLGLTVERAAFVCRIGVRRDCFAQGGTVQDRFGVACHRKIPPAL